MRATRSVAPPGAKPVTMRKLSGACARTVQAASASKARRQFVSSSWLSCRGCTPPGLTLVAAQSIVQINHRPRKPACLLGAPRSGRPGRLAAVTSLGRLLAGWQHGDPAVRGPVRHHAARMARDRQAGAGAGTAVVELADSIHADRARTSRAVSSPGRQAGGSRHTGVADRRQARLALTDQDARTRPCFHWSARSTAARWRPLLAGGAAAGHHAGRAAAAGRCVVQVASCPRPTVAAAAARLAMGWRMAQEQARSAGARAGRWPGWPAAGSRSPSSGRSGRRWPRAAAACCMPPPAPARPTRSGSAMLDALLRRPSARPRRRAAARPLDHAHARARRRHHRRSPGRWASWRRTGPSGCAPATRPAPSARGRTGACPPR